VAHTCNPSYSGSREQEDPGSKPVWANSSRDFFLKKKKPFTHPHTKRAGGVTQGVRPD
jgi:hypothetical protein